jgi:predicted phosphate transport protein (TIGR00153 family)
MTSLFSRKDEINFLQLLIQSADNALHAAQLFRQAMMGFKSPVEYAQAIKDIEHKGDQVTHQIYRGMTSVFITPLDREDIMELASKLDDVVDGIEATIACFDYLNVHFVEPHMKEFSLVIVSCCEHILEAFKLLSKKKYLQMMEHTVAINSLENEGDRLMRESIRNIFEKRTDLYQDFLLKEIYEKLEQTTDACEDVANILESVILRYS